MLKPLFQQNGSTISLQGSDVGGKKTTQEMYTCEEDLTPNYSPIVVLHFMRGVMLKLKIKM